ncbi:hypothetical protein BDV93DRAFT_561323 [Ceratobasidium sp. AG-I]|nr:hypothetical protein BDV93DRAFT_561323 [Ceratobasidium sp. AG-I]
MSKSTVAARLHKWDWHQPKHIPPSGHLRSLSFIYDHVNFRVIDTPGFDKEGVYDHLIFQTIEEMFGGYVPRLRSSSQTTATPIHFSAIYCYPLISQLGDAIKRDLQTVAALCKFFQFDSFAIFPVSPPHIPSDQKQRALLDLLRYQQIKDIWNDGAEIFHHDWLPADVRSYLISKAKPFNTPQEGVNWGARLAHAKAQLQTLPVDRNQPQEPEIVQLKSRLIQAEDFTKTLLQSLALPAYNLERKTLAKDFDDLNRDISRIVKAITRHCKVERTIGVDKLLVEPDQLDSMHKLLSKGGNRSSASLYQSKSSRQMSVKLFLQSAAALIVCEALHKHIFQPFHPGVEPGMNKMLSRAYQNVRDTNNDTMSGKWRRDTFEGLHQAFEQPQELQNAISLSIKDSIAQVLRILFSDPEAISTQQQMAFANLERPFAPFGALVRKAFELNHKIKAEAVLIGSFSTLYYAPGTPFDPQTMVVDGAGEDQGDEETQKNKSSQSSEHSVLSTFGLGLIMETGGAEQGREFVIINPAVVTDESSCDYAS